MEGSTPQWRSEKDKKHRAHVVEAVSALLSEWEPAPPKEEVQTIAVRIEAELYLSAASKAEYLDFDTLERRIEDLTHKLAVKAAFAKHPLHAACESGSLDDVRALLQGGAPVDARVSDDEAVRGPHQQQWPHQPDVVDFRAEWPPPHRAVPAPGGRCDGPQH